MTVAALTPVGTDGWLGRRHPLARLGAALLPGTALVATLDALTPALLLLVLLASLPLLGVPAGALARRGWPLLITCAGVAVANTLYAEADGGRLLLDLGPLEVRSDGALAGLAVGLRVAGIALPGLVVVATMEPRDLADALAQTRRVPARVAYGVLAALRLLPLLAAEWETLGRARRARGVDAGAQPAGGAAARGRAGGRPARGRGPPCHPAWPPRSTPAASTPPGPAPSPGRRCGRRRTRRWSWRRRPWSRGRWRCRSRWGRGTRW